MRGVPATIPTALTAARVLLTTLVMATPAHGEMVVGDAAIAACGAPEAAHMVCDYRLRNGSAVRSVTATLDEIALGASVLDSYPGPGDRTAVLLLVDTSDPGREQVIARNIEQIDRLVDAAKPYHLLALARFDSNPQVLAPFGADADTIKAAAADLRAVGMTTELYRSAIEGIRLLAQQRAARRALYVFSDGLAEDFAYGHNDVIAAAHRDAVVIYALGFARDVARSVALQSLRRLAAESGGRFIAAAGADFDLPEAFLADPFAGLDNGGRVEIDLTPAIEASVGGEQTVQLSLAGADTVARLALPVRLPPPEPLVRFPVTTPSPLTVPAPAPAPAPVAPAAPMRSPLETWIWFGTPAAFLLVVVIALVVYGRMWKRRGAAAAAVAPTGKPFAWLIRQDDDSVRYPLSNSPWRIGRSNNNDLSIDDHSVSRQHAEIHRRHDGSFSIMDLDSLNGVFVNDRKVKQADIAEGDSVDIGDVGLRFTLYDDDKSAQEPTLMIRTRTPGPTSGSA